jgi:hypothetical protein
LLNLEILVREDAKRAFRNTQIEAEGNDPQETGQSYGTPHDLASLYGKGRYYDEPDNVPAGYNEKEKGRPEEKFLILIPKMVILVKID